ncbi:MAG: transcription antitermination factor NusB [Bdellovibrio sp. 28-41-41]|jgi:N utilization substance protein B|nr:MAG: transcription antitermination factor NusB [Bdellovibrio sp. 28-41-41]
MNQDRRNARELALQLLFQSEFAPQISVYSFLQLYDNKYGTETIEYAEQIIKGVAEAKTKIDDKISSVSRNWKVDRMALVDRNILRVAIYEMKLGTEKLSEKIVINEAIEIAKKYGNTDSAGFINGILDQVGREEWL